MHIMLVTGNLVTPMKNYMELRNLLISNVTRSDKTGLMAA